MLLQIVRIRSAVAAGAVVALALPAAAETLYHWRSEDGAYAFADDLKRVPERYRAQVEVRESETLDAYARFTPGDPGATSDYARELDAYVQRLREFNASSGARGAGSAASPAAATPRIDVRLADDEPVVQVPTDGAAGPIIIEKIRLLPDGANRTRTNTIVRQGDRVLAIIRPTTVHESLQYRSESELEN